MRTIDNVPSRIWNLLVTDFYTLRLIFIYNQILSQKQILKNYKFRTSLYFIYIDYIKKQIRWIYSCHKLCHKKLKCDIA